MRIDGITLGSGSKITNMVVDSGTSFPSNPDTGELFYYNTNDVDEGLYCFDAEVTLWRKVTDQPRGGSTNRVFYENDQFIGSSYTISSGKNAMSAGPVTINDGIVVTISDGSVWTIV